MKTLDTLEIGDKVCIKNINNDKLMKRRFLDMGLTPGSIVECVLKSPAGDPIAYMIRGTVIAIRKDDAKNIQVEVIL